MLEIISDENEIHTAQNRLKSWFFNHPGVEVITGRVGHLGDQFQVEFYWLNIGIWFATQIEENSRYWNGFGLDKPKPGAGNNIVCEINPPLKGISRRISGLFLKDELGNIYLGHRGKFGGGTGRAPLKEEFFTYFKGDVREIWDQDKSTEVVIVGPLSDRIPSFVKSFVEQVQNIKSLKLRNELTHQKILLQPFVFNPEQTQRSPYAINDEIVTNCTHGLVVNELRNYLENQGFNIANTQKHDLVTYDNDGNSTQYFEVKSKSDLQSIYTGIGQLFLNETDLKGSPDKILVLPENTSKDKLENIEKLSIKVALFSMDQQDKVNFKDLRI